MSRPRSKVPGTPETIGVDTGGTFTDLVTQQGGRTVVGKVPSTPDDPSRAVLEGVEGLAGPGAASHPRLVHGTTVALNALLTGRLARTALVTNAGFEDLLEIGRQDRPELYALHPRKPAPIVPRELRFGVGQRSWPDPERGPAHPVEVARPSRAELERLCKAVRASGAEAVAVCLLHSYADPAIEQRVAKALQPLGLPVTCSAGLLREYREVERFSTAAVNAALVPIVRDYLRRLERALPEARLELMQSSGGTLSAAAAAEEPVRVLLSGPAGGVIGAARAAHQAGFDRLVGLDMGGTSTDVAFRDVAGGTDGASGRGETPAVAGHPLAIPMLDIHTIGCGGGSLIEVDAGGVLHVGPASAGADPGPVCYGRSDRPTLTDAHVLLGHIAPGAFLDGQLELDVDAVARAFEGLGARLGVRPEQAAQGALDVARAGMRRAVGVMTMQRGQDPEALPLVAFGGAGGLHGAALASGLRMQAALVPADPGVLSALGMTAADALVDLSESALAPLAERGPAARRRIFARLAAEGRSALRDAGHPAGAIEVVTELDLRYAGQSSELRIADQPRGRPSEALAEAFHAKHEALWGYRLEREVELVNARVRALVQRPLPARRRAAPRARRLPASAVAGERRAWFAGAGQPRAARVPVIERTALAVHTRFEGPAVVQEYSGTTLVPPKAVARVVPGGHLLIATPAN